MSYLFVLPIYHHLTVTHSSRVPPPPRRQSIYHHESISSRLQSARRSYIPHSALAESDYHRTSARDLSALAISPPRNNGGKLRDARVSAVAIGKMADKKQGERESAAALEFIGRFPREQRLGRYILGNPRGFYQR